MSDSKELKPRVKRKGTPRKPPNAGKGRKPGVPNKATANAREAIARLIDGNADRLQGWLDQIAEEQGPEKAVRCFTDLLEYHVPKLARTEVTGKDGEPQQHQVAIVIKGVD